MPVPTIVISFADPCNSQSQYKERKGTVEKVIVFVMMYNYTQWSTSKMNSL